MSPRLAMRFGALCLLSCALLGYPLLALFNLPRLVGGVPLLYGYLFTAWLLVVIATALIAEAGRD
jgi:hypothetical protein